MLTYFSIKGIPPPLLRKDARYIYIYRPVNGTFILWADNGIIAKKKEEEVKDANYVITGVDFFFFFFLQFQRKTTLL